MSVPVTDFALRQDTSSSGGSTGVSSGGSPSSGGSGSGVTEAERHEIVAKHNAFRRNVQPSASNMLEMVTHRDVLNL